MILVINPIIQYTAFEQLKNFLVARRTNKLRAAGAAAAVAVLSDWDFFLLGALSKLGKILFANLILLADTLQLRPALHTPTCLFCMFVCKTRGLIFEFFSVVKSRLQAGSANALKYKSSFDGLLTILKEEGVEGLYKGIGSKIMQSVLTAAILFAGQRRIFEMTKKVRVQSKF